MPDKGILLGKQIGTDQEARPSMRVRESADDGLFTLVVENLNSAPAVANQITLIEQNNTIISQNLQIINSLQVISDALTVSSAVPDVGQAL